MKASGVNIRSFTTGVLLLAAALPLAQASVFITNGSYESQPVPAGYNLVNPGGVDSGNVTDWSIGGNPGDSLYLVHGGGAGLTPYDGDQHVAFNGGETAAGGTLSQTFSTTIGDSYSVSYVVGRVGPGPGFSSLHGEILSATSAVLGQADSSPVSVGWLAPTTFLFTATTTTTTIRFTDLSTSTVSVDVTLDAVSVSAVPEPEAYAALAGIALMGFGVSRRFRK